MHPEFFRQPCAPFTAQVLRDAGAWASKHREIEVCGLVRAGKFVPCENASANPRETFEISALIMAEAYLAGDLEGVVHSHPGGPWRPSAADMAGQIETAVPWAILVPGDAGSELACHWGLPRPPVFKGEQHIQRAFLHGVSDCYSLMQDYFAETKGVVLSDFPREWEWWKTPETENGLYLDNLEAEGFEVLSRSPHEYGGIAKAGDAYLMALDSNVPNHAGAYLGNNLILEHLFTGRGDLSRIKPIASRQRRITHWLRLKD